jgi:hypothetical protein
MKHSLSEFTRPVNEISIEECIKFNAAQTGLFRACHVEMPSSMLEYFHKQDITPEETFIEIQLDGGY